LRHLKTQPKALAFRPACFINRELSWLAFNERVLGEAMEAGNPLLETAEVLLHFQLESG